MTSVKVLLFGPARDAADGADSVLVSTPELPLSLSVLRGRVHDQCKDLRFVLMNSVFAVDNALIPKSREDVMMIQTTDSEIVLIPPVSGG